MQHIFTAAIAALGLIVGSASFAQESVKPIKEGTLTEDIFVNALKLPAQPDADEQQMKTRGIMPVGPRELKANTKPVTPRSAPLMLTFETNSANLSAAAKKTLDVVGKSLARPELSSMNFIVEGHADKRGNSAENLRLSQSRAESVQAYLVSRWNTAVDRLKAIGKGDQEPALPARPAAPENRRVTFVATP